MKKYYLCRFYACLGGEVAKNAFQFLTYTPFWGKEQKIPIVLIEENDDVLEFFTKTKFEGVSNQYGIREGLSLPNSTLCYWKNHTYATLTYSEVTPAEALKILDPCVKNMKKYVPRIHAYFDCFRKEFEQKQEEICRQNKANDEADRILSGYLRKR